MLTQFVDRAFLDYAVKSKIPDFEAMKREEQRRRSTIQANMGKLTKDVPEMRWWGL